MPLPFDATVKDLVKSYPRDWLKLLGGGEGQLVSADLSNVTASADLVFQCADRIVHLDIQSGPDASLPGRALQYNVMLFRQYELPVESVVVLLRRRAQHPSLTGVVQYAVPGGESGLTFRYRPVRVWERSAEDWLNGGLGLAPLATLGGLPEGADERAALAAVVRRLDERLHAEAEPPVAAKLLTASFILTGLRLPRNEALPLFQGVAAMRDSDTYQAILEEGELRALHRFLLRRGTARLGQADAVVRTAVEGIRDVERLELLCERVNEVSSWQELFVNPAEPSGRDQSS